jgi:hypothetical protein
MSRHRWADKVVISPNKSERECRNGCGIVKVSRHEYPAGNPFGVHWPEFWRGLDKIECEGTPPCTGRAQAVSYDARNYPL